MRAATASRTITRTLILFLKVTNKLGLLFKGDKVIWMIFFFLCIISIVEVFSASSFLTFKGGSYWMPVLKHIGTIIAGFIAMYIVHMTPCKYFKIMTFPMLLLSLVLVYVVLAFGASTNGASRWMAVGGMQFQPSEIAKGTLVLVVAQVLGAMQTERGADKQAFWWILGVSAIVIMPILVENFSTGFLLSAVVFLMMFVGRVPFAQLGRLLGVVIAAAVICVLVIVQYGKDDQALKNERQPKTALVETVRGTADDDEAGEPKRKGVLHRLDTWKSRINGFLSPEVPPEKYDLDKDAQKAHANIAIINSNVIGCGPGNSEERDFLSQAFSDFIYAIIIEEMGIVGAAAIAILYVVLFWRAGRIARQCANNFPAFLVMGLSTLFVLQALVNMLVAVDLMPVTGQPLPLISKGGSSTLINCIYIGMILSVSRTAKKRDNTSRPVTAGTAGK